MYTKPNIKNYNELELLNLIGPGHSNGYVNIQGALAFYNTESVQKQKPATMLVQLKDLKEEDRILV